MSNIREAFAATSFANLQWSEISERPIDRVAASGLCDELGVLLWKLKYMCEASAYKKAREELIKRHQERYRYEVDALRSSVVDQCLYEFLYDKCKWCKGAKEMIVGERRVVCDACQGYGIRKFTNSDRSKYMKQSMGRIKTLEGQFKYVHDLIGTLDRKVNSMMCEQLERY